MKTSPARQRALYLAAALALVTCGPEGTDDPSGTSTDGEATTGELELAQWGLHSNRDLDILFVIDNSASMGEEQRKLAAAIPTFVRALEAANANYRVAITTADMGNPRCTPTNYPRSPNRGEFTRDSCRAHLGEDGGDNWFEFAPELLDAAYACTDYCDPQVHAAMLGAYAPTPIEQDDSVVARPWFEYTGTQTNLPDALTSAAAALPENNDADPNNDVSPIAAALRCALPQGINGCGFESQLDSMYYALARAEEPSEQNYGFLRDASYLSIVVLTDEADCSYIEAQQAIFLDVGGAYVWAWEPGATSPTSAVCWNAGVECEGDGPTYITCDAVNRSLSGEPLEDYLAEDDAVLKPLSLFVKQLNAIEQEKRFIDQRQEVLVSVIAGVPEGYADGAAELQYADDPDVDDQIRYGIGPGCEGADGDSAIPPVRLRELAEAFAVDGERNLFSSCAPDYGDTLAELASRVAGQIEPGCMTVCVADTTPDTELLDPNCRFVDENSATGDHVEIPECELDASSQPTPPTGHDVCYRYRLDSEGLTPSAADDMSEQCVEEGWNLEVDIIRIGPREPGSVVRFGCELSDLVERDCPGLL